ncbi:MAG: polyprenyl synthetase family protein [Tannerella sp.]|jgi:geranylgeranyl diphosphate synthase type II|nr:polyprenyl synthetase family protein [Tannerella sp.]
MLTTEQIAAQIDAVTAGLHYNQTPRSLYEPVEYILSLGGKRIRPVLTLMAYNIYGDTFSDVMPAALGIEVFHNFTLLHDDLMDCADMRRGKPTVHRKWHDNTAILSGDAMVIAAYQLIGEVKYPYLKPVLDVFSQTAMDICRGQQYDMDFEKRNDVSEEEYIEMIRLKTAVLLACSVKVGAMIGAAPESDAEQLYRYGINIGLAFQLRDDLLDVYGDPNVFGKNIGGDILTDKKTFLRITAMSLASQEQKKVLEFYSDNANDFTPEVKVKALTDIYNKLNIKEITQNKILDYYHLATEDIKNMSVSDDKLIELKRFADMLILRES